MNFTNGTIIAVALVSVLIVIIVIARSFRNVDEEIINSIENETAKKKLLVRIKQKFILLVDKIIGWIRRAVKNMHLAVRRAKKTNKNEVSKAKSELVIDDNNNHKDPNNTNNKVTTDRVANNIDNFSKKKEGSIFKKATFKKDKEEPMDSIIISNKNEKRIGKTSFIKSLFKGSSKKKTVDILKKNKKLTEEDANRWSLNEHHNDTSAQESIINSNEIDEKNDDVNLGVDRKILEKKILQRIDKDPKNIDNYHELGELYLKMRKYDDAVEVFGYILTVSPNDLEAKRRQDKIKLLKKAEN
jgi:tetratricopeptide (TPR) repeat protein